MRLIVSTGFLITIILIFPSWPSSAQGKSEERPPFDQTINKPASTPVILINEIMFDPDPPAGLPSAEYIELYNPGSEPANLGGWILNTSVLPGFLLQPDSYVIICDQKNEQLFVEWGSSIGVGNWDVLNNQGQEIKLVDRLGHSMDQLTYTPGMIADPEKRSGGWSLELINPYHTCKGKLNWSESEGSAGGTPGMVNSVYSLAEDNLPPGIQDHYIAGDDSMVIIFSEPVVISDPPGKSHVEFTPHLRVDSIVFSGNDPEKISISLGSSFVPGILYELRIENFSDCLGNVMNDTLIQTGIGKNPDFADLLVTEIMFDEIPARGLPDTEYIEILVVVDQLLDLSHFRLLTRKDTLTLPAQILLPDSYYILCPARNRDSFPGTANVIGVDGFPRLLNNGMVIALIDPDNEIIHSLSYSKDWYNDPDKSSGGFSIEMIDINNPCGDRKNWAATDNSTGGTPGKPNSIMDSNPDLSGPAIESAYASENETLLVRMSERLHPESIHSALLKVEPSGNYELRFPDPFLHQVLEVKFPEKINTRQKYDIEITGIRDCAGNKAHPSDSKSFFYLPEAANSDDLIISEILFNPKPGGTDWIEIYNRSDKYLDPNSLTLGRYRNENILKYKATDPLYKTIFPGQYYVFTTQAEKLMADFPFSVREQIFEIESLPDMPDQGGNLVLMDTGNLKFDHIEYSSNMHHPLLRNDEGVSLERIDFDMPALSANNWESASFASGYGTPTKKNSNQGRLQTDDNQINLDSEVFSPDPDGYLDQLTIRYHLASHGYLASIFVFDLQGRPIKKLASNRLMGVEGVLYWDGSTDRGTVADTGYYIILFELYDLAGNYEVVKKKVALYKK